MALADKPLVCLRGEIKTHPFVDTDRTWRVVYRVDSDAIVIADVFPKTTPQTPARKIADCKRRLKLYDRVTSED